MNPPIVRQRSSVSISNDKLVKIVLKLKADHESKEQIHLKRRRPRLVWLMFCLIGCFYQSYILTSNYLDYEMSTEAIHYPMDPIQPPAITICIVKPFRQPCQNDTCDEYMESSQAFFNNSYKFNEVFDSLILTKSNGHVVVFDTATNLTLFQKRTVNGYKLQQMMCFQIVFTLYDPSIVYLNDFLNNMALPVVIEVYFNMSFIKSHRPLMHIMLSSAVELPIRIAGALLAINGNATTVFTYRQK